MTKAAIYCRISRDPQGLRAGVERQEKECRALAERRGWTVAGVYVDNDLSAWSGKRRPEYERMLADVEASRVRAVVAWHLDRLTRSPKELERFFEVCYAAGVRQFATVSGDIDLSSRDGQLQARILGAVAKKSSDDASARIRAAFDAKAARGEYKRGGVRPFGYEWSDESGRLEIREDEAALLREAAERIIAGESRRSITRDWHERGIRTSEGRPWSITRLGELVASPRIVGKRVHRGEIVGDGNWPTILDARTQRRVVQQMRRQPAGHKPGRQRHLLTGLVHCGECGSRLQAKARKDRAGRGFRTYRCSNDSAASCGGCSVLAEPLEQLIMWTAWMQVAPDPGSVFKDAIAAGDVEDPAAQRLRDLAADLADRERQLAHDHYVDGILSRDAFLDALARLREDQLAAERELSSLERTGGPSFSREQVLQLHGPPASLGGADPEAVEFWRSVVGAVFERVDVASWRGRRFNPDRVTLVPRPEFPDAARPWPTWDLPTMPPDQLAEVAGVEPPGRPRRRRSRTRARGDVRS
jgi:site-specific DNA recombinase